MDYIFLLRIESPTRSLDLSAPEGVTIQAEQGPVRINSGSADVKLESYNQVTYVWTNSEGWYLLPASLYIIGVSVHSPKTVFGRSRTNAS